MSTICMNPFTLSEDKGGHKVPCGKCLNCKRRRASSWSVRLMKEYERSTSGYFLTLTYDTHHVDITNKGFMTLNKKHLQDFFKRLRQWHEKNGISLKYYAVGEYGGKTFRPHYHIILFNANVEYIEKSWAKCTNKKSKIYQSLGQIHYGSLTEASVGYTLKYICKSKRIPLHSNDDRIPEFSLMSKGLGSNYLTDKMVKWHKNNPEERIYVPLKDNKKAPMPRYYKEKIYDEYEKEKIAYHWKNKSDLLKQKEIAELGNNYQSYKEQVYFNGERKLKNNHSSKI